MNCQPAGLLLRRGEALLFGSLSLLAWAILFVTINAIYIPLHEEPRLERRFGDHYRRYKQRTPRWIPRLRPLAAGDGESVV